MHESSWCLDVSTNKISFHQHFFFLLSSSCTHTFPIHVLMLLGSIIYTFAWSPLLAPPCLTCLHLSMMFLSFIRVSPMQCKITLQLLDLYWDSNDLFLFEWRQTPWTFVMINFVKIECFAHKLLRTEGADFLIDSFLQQFNVIIELAILGHQRCL